jgi:hypothetical protein
MPNTNAYLSDIYGVLILIMILLFCCLCALLGIFSRMAKPEPLPKPNTEDYPQNWKPFPNYDGTQDV